METALFEPLIEPEAAAAEKLPRYCFEQYQLAHTTMTSIYVDEDDTEWIDDQEEEVLAYWAIYDRKRGHLHPIAYTETADVAQKIVDALNRTS